MTIEEGKKLLKELQIKLHALNHASSSIYLDSVTVAPSDAAEGRGVTLALLSELSYDAFVNDETVELLSFLEAHTDALTSEEARQCVLLRRELEQTTKIPKDEYVAYTVLLNDSEAVWHKAKAENDFTAFAPYLKKVFDTQRRFAGYFNPDKAPYDVLLDQYERGLTTEVLDKFFSSLRSSIVPLLHAIQEKGQSADLSFMSRAFPIDIQRKFSDYLMDIMTIDRSHCAIGETEHPFTLEFNNKDVRITTHYFEDSVVSSLYSVVHEGGHALYELGIDDKHMYTSVGHGVSMSIHESQSRFFENMIGRSRAFTDVIYTKLCELFPAQMSGVDSDVFYRGVNDARASLIRTEADELTYCLHIMVRYELEKQIINSSLDVDELPRKWNELYREYLGVAVPDDTHGILQDSHWSGGMVGYFPSYAIGSAYAAQMLHSMKKDFDVDASVRAGDLSAVVLWLRERIHRFGGMYDPDEVLLRCTGEAFDPSYYTAYLTEKFSDIYSL